jgi:hypothetical protein
MLRKLAEPRNTANENGGEINSPARLLAMTFACLFQWVRPRFDLVEKLFEGLGLP